MPRCWTTGEREPIHRGLGHHKPLPGDKSHHRLDKVLPVLQNKRATCNGKSQDDLNAFPTSQLKEKASLPPILKPLGPIQTKSGVLKDIDLRNTKPLNLVNGANMAAKPPLPPTRARATVTNNVTKNVPHKPVRPEGSPHLRRQVRRKHVHLKTPTKHVDDLPPSLEEIEREGHNAQNENLMDILIRNIEELTKMQDCEEMDAQMLVEKMAKERILKSVREEIGDINLMQEDRDLWEMITDYQEEEERRMEKRENREMTAKEYSR
ncbi:uncharacterized protein LOC114839321 isoform X2 [Esox lucius]|uniref:uncharacterized protein LOC114839321 isoform X2 n=1 Tax=Esox lucius TaxID=8010 RepID=UPI00147709EC|nr:uncharacterized protein LOC114839321 isoform X2 [Esox lucius]